MEIEFEVDSDAIEILEHIVRDVDWFGEEEHSQRKPHLQARVRAKNKDVEGYQTCSISYYGEQGEFLGIDSGSFHMNEGANKLPAALSIPLDTPSNARKMVVTVSSESNDNSFVEICVGLGVILILVVLGAWAVSSVVGLLNA